jgi:electron transfer flavoprotein alpha/beta subunit
MHFLLIINIKLISIFKVISVEDPPVREAGIIVADANELVAKLKEKGF